MMAKGGVPGEAAGCWFSSVAGQLALSRGLPLALDEELARFAPTVRLDPCEGVAGRGPG
jgi:hypothetical protein